MTDQKNMTQENGAEIMSLMLSSNNQEENNLPQLGASLGTNLNQKDLTVQDTLFIKIVKTMPTYAVKMALKVASLSDNGKEEAFMTAVYTKKSELVSMILDEFKNDISQIFKEEVFIIAVNSGYDNLLPLLIKEIGKDISLHTKGQAIIDSAITGTYKTTALLINRIREIGEEIDPFYKTCAFIKAVENSKYTTVERLLDTVGDEIDGFHKTQALIDRAKAGDNEMIKILLPIIGNEINLSPKVDALISAAKAGEDKTVELLMTEIGSEIYSLHKGEILIEAATSGKLQVVQVLLNLLENDELIQYAKEKAAFTAKLYGHDDVAKLFSASEDNNEQNSSTPQENEHISSNTIDENIYNQDNYQTEVVGNINLQHYAPL